MSRWWTETVAALGDVMPLHWVALLLLLVTTGAAGAWFWLPGRSRPPAAKRPPAHDLPDLPAEVIAEEADRLAERGHWAEAVRERHRAMVRELVDRGVVENRPGWTVTELAGAAGQGRPRVDGPLRAAGTILSDLWYGQVPARPEHDVQMRTYAAALHDTLADTGGTR